MHLCDWQSDWKVCDLVTVALCEHVNKFVHEARQILVQVFRLSSSVLLCPGDGLDAGGFLTYISNNDFIHT